MDRPLGIRGVLMLDDGLEAALRIPENPPVAGGIVDDGSGERRGRRGFAVMGVHNANGLSPDQGSIAAEYHHITLEILEQRLGAGDGVTGAKLGFLDRVFDVGIITRKCFSYMVSTMSHNQDDAAGPGFPGGANDPIHHRTSANRMDDLGQVAVHAGSLARRENDRGERTLFSGAWYL